MSVVLSSYRKTRKGSIIKSVREHYLREDIYCGREECRSCAPHKPAANDRFRQPFYLADRPRVGVSKLVPEAHYVLVDAGSIAQQIDVIADEAFGEDIIVLLSAWREVRGNVPLFSKLKELMASRRFFLYDNEHNREIYRSRKADESAANYKQNLALESAEWLRRHFGDIEIVFLTSDNVVAGKVRSLSVEDYVQSLEKATTLLDKLAELPIDQDDAKEGKNKDRFLYEEHMPLVQIQTQLKSGTLHKGKFRSSTYNYLEGSVTVTIGDEEVSILIQGREAINRAVNEDIVAVRLLPRDQWKVKPESIIDENLAADDEGGNRVLDAKENSEPAIGVKTDRPVGKVVSIIKRNWRSYCGVLKDKANVTLATNNFLFVPVDKRIPFIRVSTRQYTLLKGKKILVALDSWPRDSMYPRGHYTKIIGDAGEKETETDVLLLEHNVPHTEFSAQVLNCLPAEGDAWRPEAKDLAGRVDLREMVVCSVDPVGCTDIDDALHCRDLGDGRWEVGVHIADVSHFIKPSTAIDREAAERGTTVYLADRRIDMVPGLLSSNLCSLREEKERLAFSCIWNIESATGKILETKFTKSIIKSKAALTYGAAQLKIDTAGEEDEVANSLRRLNTLAKILKASRIAKGALVLASANEIKFVEVESETADSELAVVEKKMLETNSMVEEFMLLANISVAERIYQVFPNFAVLRRHPKPSAANFEELLKAAANRGFEIDVTDGKSLSDSLEKAVDPQNEHLNLMLRMITTRCMSQAVYFCSGSLSSEPGLTFAHYGLASEIYTHFTSPIRRYADVMVHRLLAHAIGHETLAPSVLEKRKIAQVCEHINTRNMNARRASRSSSELYSYLYVRGAREGAVEEVGHIFTLKENALIIFIMHLSFEVIYSIDANWEVDKDKGLVVHQPTGTRLRQFDSVKVRLSIDKQAMVSSFKRQIVVELLDPKIVAEPKTVRKKVQKN